MSTQHDLLPILRLCVGSLVKHATFLQSELPASHPLFGTHLFTNGDTMKALRDALASNETSVVPSWMHPTGVPPYIMLYEKLDRQHSTILQLPSEIENRISSLLETCGVAAGNITKGVLESTIASLITKLRLDLDSGAATSNDANSSTIAHRDYLFWKGRWHTLPEDFTLPKVDPFSAWRLWWFGNPQTGYPPYRTLNTRDMNEGTKRMYSEWSVLMGHIISSIEAVKQCTLPVLKDETKAYELFKIGYENLRFKRPKRLEQAHLSTIMKLIRQQNQIDKGTLNKVVPYKKRKRSSAHNTHTFNQ